LLSIALLMNLIQIQGLIRQAQLVQRDEEMPDARQVALELFKVAENEITSHMTEINHLLQQHHAKGEILKKEAAAHQAQVSSSTNKGKEKEKEQDKDDDTEDDDDEEDNVEDRGIPKTPAGKEHKAKTHSLKARLREAKLVLHQIKFLMGDVYHVLERSKEEDEAYQAADDLRKELLKSELVSSSKVEFRLML